MISANSSRGHGLGVYWPQLEACGDNWHKVASIHQCHRHPNLNTSLALLSSCANRLPEWPGLSQDMHCNAFPAERTLVLCIDSCNAPGSSTLQPGFTLLLPGMRPGDVCCRDSAWSCVTAVARVVASCCSRRAVAIPAAATSIAQPCTSKSHIDLCLCRRTAIEELWAPQGSRLVPVLLVSF